MTSLRPPSSPSPSPSPVPGANGKNASARASMGPAARPSAGGQGFNLASPRPGGGPPSGRPTSELLGSATFQTPEGESCSQSIDSFVCFSFLRRFGTFLSRQFTIPPGYYYYCFVLAAPALSGWASHSYHCFVSIFASGASPHPHPLPALSRDEVRIFCITHHHSMSPVFLYLDAGLISSQRMPSTNGLKTFIITKSRWSAFMSHTHDHSSHSRLWISNYPLL
jgi:hypothetical protein